MTTTLATRIGDRIRRARVGADLSQGALAALLGVTQTAVSYWECGDREPGLNSLAGLVRVLQINPLFLLGVISGEERSDYEAGFDDGWAACAKQVVSATERGKL